MKNIHILPTSKLSRLYYNNNDKQFQLCKIEKISTVLKSNQNIYITSNEEIKEGDWIYNSISNTIYQKKLDKISFAYEYKIILTIDQDLIKDDVQSIDNDFLEWFINNSNYEKVEVVNEPYEAGNIYQPNHFNYYRIIIPKEQYLIDIENHENSLWEEPKIETLEEAAEYYWLNDNTMTDNDRISYVNGFLSGAKWQQKRSYSEEEVKEILLECTWILKSSKLKWFKQFKNK